MISVSQLRKELIQQKESKFKGNIYHWTQVNFAYNSNKIEGSKLTAEQTEMIFDTHSLITKTEESIKMDDLIEATNHFKLFDYALDHINDPLSKEMFIQMNMILKRNTTDEMNPRYNVGGFKVVPNIIGMINVIKTTPPEKVEEELNQIISSYNSKEKITFDDIVEFHVRFERIHPFGDGNGRVGRMIIFKECLRHDIVPFIILDQHKDFYIRGLREYDRDKGYLLDTCLNEQDIYTQICETLLDFHLKKEEQEIDIDI